MFSDRATKKHQGKQKHFYRNEKVSKVFVLRSLKSKMNSTETQVQIPAGKSETISMEAKAKHGYYSNEALTFSALARLKL